MSYGGNPVLDAERHTDRLGYLALEDAMVQAQRDFYIAEARKVGAAMDAIHTAYFTEETAAHIVALLTKRITASNWAHTDKAETAVSALSNLHDDLTGRVA